MSLDQLQDKLLAAARARLPADRVPFAFEKRVLARLKELPPMDIAALWARALWRAAMACVVLALLLGVWSLVGERNTPVNYPPVDSEAFSQHFEQTMLAGVNEFEEVW